MTGKPEATAGPPPSVDVQDPLPESSFFWRRVYSWLISVGVLALIGLVVWQITGADELRRVALYLVVLLWFVITYYMIAPSAEQIVKILKTAELFKYGVQVRQTSTAASQDGQAATETVVGQPAAPTTQPEVTSEEEDAAPRSRFQ